MINILLTAYRTDSTTDAAKQQLGNRKPADSNSLDKLKLSPRDKEDKDDKDDKDKKDDEQSSLKIKITLDLEVEVHLTARIKGDITIGLL